MVAPSGGGRRRRGVRDTAKTWGDLRAAAAWCQVSGVRTIAEPNLKRETWNLKLLLPAPDT
jgi:hypothetical protein